LKYLSEILRPALFLTLFTIYGLNAQIKTNNPDSLINIVLRAGENGLENGVYDQIISKLYNLEYNTAKNLASSLLEKSKVPSLQLFRGYMLVHSYRFFDYQQSIRNLTEAQKTAEKLKNTELLTAVYTFKSIVYRDNMISDSAMTYALMLRDILAESGKQVELLGNLQMIGDMHYYAGEFEEAEKMYRRVLDEQPGIKDNFNYRVLMNNLGLIRIKQKRCN
jgi:tetratricopeptide (TPR) repeat protein